TNQIDVEAAFNSFGSGSSTVLRYLTSGDEKLAVGVLQHRQRLNAEGLELSLSYTKSESEPDLTIVDPDFARLRFETDTQIAGAMLSYPLVRTRERNIYVRGGLTYHQGLTEQLGFPTIE